MAVSAKRVALAYSGGLDTSIIIPWLKEHYNCEVIAVAADVGQGEELEGLREKALDTGASEIYIEDLRHEFVTEYIFPTLRAGAVYEHKYLLGTSFARPVIAKKQVEVALRTGCDAVAHGCTGKGNDQVRFELTYQALAPQLDGDRAVARMGHRFARRCDRLCERAEDSNYCQPREDLQPRSQHLAHLARRAEFSKTLRLSLKKECISFHRSPENAPDKPEYVEITFEKATPVAVNGENLDPVPLLERLNEIGSRNGVGQDRPGRESARRNQITGMLRNPGRNAPADGASRARSSLSRSRIVSLQGDSSLSSMLRWSTSANGSRHFAMLSMHL